MKYLRIAVLLSSVGLTAVTTGCAVITGGVTQDVSVKTQKDAVEVAGADCVLTNSRGTYKVTTPGKVNVHRSKDDLSVQCSKKGESDAATAVKSSFRKGAMAGNIVMVGVGALVLEPIDTSTGAAYAYPDDVTVSFGTPEMQQPIAGASVPVAASTPIVSTDSSASTNSASTQTN